jgi:hypothetical protein
MPKAFRDFAHFLKVYFALKRQVDPEKAAATLGRPATLELTREQAELVQELFLPVYTEAIGSPGLEPKEVARGFFCCWPRTSFRYFMSLTPDGLSLEFTNADPALDGVELIQAAMVKLGAIVKHEDDGEWYYQTAHPMVKRLAELGANQGDIENMTAKKRLFA